MFGALATACEQVAGQYSHRHPALQAVRAAIELRIPGREWKRRLAEFNSEANSRDAKAVLSSTVERRRRRSPTPAEQGL